MPLHIPPTVTDTPSGRATWFRQCALTVNQIIATYLPLSGGTLTGDMSVPDEAYGVAWNGSLEVPTKNALYDKIETISGGGVSDGDKGDIVVSGSGAVWSFDSGVVTAFAKTFLDDADAAAVRTTLGVTGTGADTAYAFRANNLSDLANAATARTNLGLAIGTNVQAHDADLDALAANSTNGLWARTGAGTGAARTITAPAAGITVSNGDGAAGNPTLALADDLAALEALSGTNTIYYRSAANTWTAVTISNDLLFSGGTLGRNRGTSFPGSPATDDIFYRTDRRIEYFYDGTRWLSTVLYTLPIAEQDALNPIAATTGFKHRTVNPWAGKYDIYVEEGVFGYYLTAAGNWTLSIVDQNAVTLITTTVSTATTHTTVRVAENTAYSNSSYANFNLSATENSGTASLYLYAALTYRLIG